MPEITYEIREPQQLNVESYVREFYKETPILIEIARCESRFRHWDEDGQLLLGEVDPNDQGVMQINRDYHEETYKALGFDVSTLEGNLGFARHLYQREQTRPWEASRGCWGAVREYREL